MSLPGPGPLAVTLFTGGRGGASIARELLGTPGVSLSLVINGYDNGLSTGALRQYLPGMLGPSDFRKNLLLHMDRTDPRQAALVEVLEHRFPAGATRADLDALLAGDPAPVTATPEPERTAIVRDLNALRRRLDTHPDGLEFADCALGNLVLAGAYLRLGGDFNAAVGSCARTFRSPARLLNITNGENAFLAALKQDGRLLADEAEIVGPQDAVPITELFLLAEPVPARRRTELAALPTGRLRQQLAGSSAQVSLNPQAREAILDADLIVYGPGTPHSSLLPSYLTPGVADAVAGSRARAKVFVANIRADHDVQGLAAPDLVERTLDYLGDPGNDRRTVTHVLCPGGPVAPRRRPAGVEWVAAELADPHDPGIHSGRRTVAALTRIAGGTRAAPGPACVPARPGGGWR